MLKKYFSPEILFCLVIFIGMPVCISYRLLDPFVSPRVILIAAFSILMLAVLMFRKPEDAMWLRSVPVISLVIFLLLYALSVRNSLNAGDAWYEWLKTFLAIPVMLIASVLFRKSGQRIILLQFSQLTVLMLSCVYIFQWIKLARNPSLETVWGYSLNVASTLGNKNFYAELVCLLLVFSVISFFTFKKFLKYFSLFNVFLLLITLVATKSMAAIASVVLAGFISGVALYSSLPERKFSVWKMTGISAIVILICAVIFFQTGASKSVIKRIAVLKQYVNDPSIADSTDRINNNSAFERILLWRNTAQLIKENPVTGCGAGNWKLLYPKFGISGTRYIETGSVHYEHPHNDYLLIASEAGVPALIAFILFLISVAWIAFTRIRMHKNNLWFAGILFAVISFAVISIFSFPRLRFYSWIQLAVFIGLLFSLTGNEYAGEKKPLNGIWKIVLLVCGLICTWSLVAGVTRYQGELHSKLLQVAKKQMNFARIIRESAKASSWYFPVDETATPFAWYTGMAHFYSGEIPQARAAYEEAYKENPYHIQLLNDYATTLEQTNEREKAIALYKEALTITPFFPHSLLNISACYFNEGKKDSAFIYIDKVYGIRLTDQQRKSYKTYLSAILREKIYADSASFPEDVKAQAMSLARDTSFVSSVYRKSKLRGQNYSQAITDSLRNK
jgi:O-antigen ligase